MNAQGALGKLKDKVSQAGSGSIGATEKDWNGFDVPSKKEGQKDIENPALNSQSLKKDKFDVAGIYIAQKPIGFCNSDYKMKLTVQKFAIEVNQDGKGITIYHSGVDKGMQPINCGSSYFENSWYDADISLYSKGTFFQLRPNNEYTLGGSVSYLDSIQYEGKPAKNNVKIEYISQLEPGVFVFHNLVRPVNGVTTCDGGSEIAGEKDPNQWSYITFNILAKEGKDVSKWTNEAIVKELKRQSDMRCGMILKDQASKSSLPAKYTKSFPNRPSDADLLAAVRKRAKDFGWIETITYVYPVGEWTDVKKAIGSGVPNTLVGRTLETIAVMKTPSGECAFETVYITMDNNYTQGSFQENYGSNKIYASSNGQLTPIDCGKTK